MGDVLARIDTALAAALSCPCGAAARAGGVYCGPDCDPAGFSLSADAARYRPHRIRLAA